VACAMGAGAPCAPSMRLGCARYGKFVRGRQASVQLRATPRGGHVCRKQTITIA
jgi:hypothetical protein